MEDVQNIKFILYIVEKYEKSIVAGYEVIKAFNDKSKEQNIYLDNNNHGYITGLQLMNKLKNEKIPCEIKWGFSYTKNGKIYSSILYQSVEQMNAAAKRDIGYDFNKVEAVSINDLDLGNKLNFSQNVKSMAYIMGKNFNDLGVGIVEKYIVIKTVDSNKNVCTVFLTDNDEKKAYTYNELMNRIIDNDYLGMRWGYKYTIGDRDVYSKTFNDISLRNLKAREELGYDFDKEEAIDLSNMFSEIESKHYNMVSDVKSIVYILEDSHIEEYQKSYYNPDSSEKTKKAFMQVDRKVLGRYVVKKVIGVNNMNEDIYLDSTSEKGFLTASELRKKVLNIGEYAEIGWGYAYKKGNNEYSFSNIYKTLKQRNDMAIKEIGYDFNNETVPDIMNVLTNLSSNILEQPVKRMSL